MKDYILFMPPEEIADMKARSWNVKEAKVYFNWFISVKDDRVEYLLTSIDETLTGDHEKDIKRIGKKVTDALQNLPFSTSKDGELTITNKGLALIADLSLLISKLIIERHPQITWKIVKRPKGDIAYNLPALFEFPLIGHIELMRGSIVEAKAILRGEKTDSIWLEIYDYVVNLIK